MAESSSGLKKSPSYREAQELLDQHIRRQKLLKKYSGQNVIKSTTDVRKEAEKILNEFLKKQNKKDVGLLPILSPHYQQVVIEDTDIKTELFDDEYKMKGENFSGDEYSVPLSHASVDAIDNIPFMDGVEDDDERFSSLPSFIQLSVKVVEPTVPTAKLSIPQSITTAEGQDEGRVPSSKSPSKSVSPSPPAESKKGSVEPVRERKRFKSGSLSDTDTDTDSFLSPDRKKKSLIKRLQERLARAMSKDREKKELDENKTPKDTEKKLKKRRARSKKRKDSHDVEILQEKHTHRKGHVEQHHGGENNEILLRTNETWETTDITDFEKSQSKHIDKHTTVKESTDLSGSTDKGFFGAIRRITSRKGKKNKSPKTSIKTSQSDYIQDLQGTNGSTKTYDRILSMPSGADDLHLHVTENTLQTKKGKHHQTTKTITSPRSPGLPKIGPIHEKSRSEPVRPSLPMTENGPETATSTIPHSFRFRGISKEKDVQLPENSSFSIGYSVDEKERTIKTKDGEVKVENDIHKSQLTPGDLETDGSDLSTRGRSPQHPGAIGGRSQRQSIQQNMRSQPESDLDDEIDDLKISRVAARIAEMGDTYISESSKVSSPTRSPDERDGEGLTELERKIRDCFRDFGDTINEKLTMSVEPSQAAIDIARQVTYSTFKDTVRSIVGEGLGWQQLAMVFYVTKKATQLAGAGGAVASQLKENCLQYVEDHFASWILNQGGWDSVLESDETDFDID